MFGMASSKLVTTYLLFPVFIKLRISHNCNWLVLVGGSDGQLRLEPFFVYSVNRKNNWNILVYDSTIQQITKV